MTGTQLNWSIRRTLWAAALTVTLTPALAADSDDKEITEVTVTGSRIARPNLESTVPVTVVSGEALFETGNTSMGDLLNDMPALRSTFSQSNSSRFLGTTGLNLLDLRGLGTQRTLVLLNGRRHVGADILSNAVSPDTNTFPSELIDRVDIVTGGSSAVYGSDAIAGVVNFILKKNYEGFSLRGQAGQSKYHDAESYFGSALWGTNFADGRGNVAVELEVSTQNPVFGSDRPNIRSANSFVTVDSDPAGPYNSDNVPDRRFYQDIRSTTIANGGLLQFVPTGGRTPCGVDPLGTAYACTQIFQPDGSLVPQTGTRVGLAPSGSYLGGNGTTGREGETYGVIPKLDRMNLNLIGHYSFSDALEAFVEAKYTRTDSMRYGSPAFFQGTTTGALTERPRFDNPFLTTGAQASIQAARAAAGLAPATAGTLLSLRKNLIDLGGRQEEATRETARFVVGLEGKIFDNWHYEASVNYGRFDESTRVLGNLDLQRFTLAMDATRDTAGNIVCRSKIDPSTADIFLDPADPYAAFATARLPGDISACVPLNPFGEGNITQAMRDYLIQDTTSIGRMDQVDVNAFISGDSGQWFSLPAGNIGLVLGAEYRTESIYFKAEDLVASGLTFYNALPLLDPPSFEVKELFTEVRVPLVKDVVMLKELTLSTAARVSDYNSNTGTVTAYNFGLDWAPINDLRFRGGIGHAIRAPNLTELYSEESQNFSAPPLINDPCSARNIGAGSSTRAANCAAAGRPADYDYVYIASLELVSGGNKALKEETSDSITVGFVYQPSWVQGLSISADYFDIDVKDNIDSPTAQQILNACYDASSLNNQFCGLFQRAGAGGGPSGEIQFQVLEASLREVLLNFSKRTASGVDIDASYALHFGNGDKLTTRLVYTYMLNRDNHLDPTDPSRANQILMELGDPKNAYNLDFGYTHNAFTAGWTVRYLSKMVVSPNFEDTFSIQGRLPENADYAEKQFYPEVYYHNMRLGYDVMENVNVYGGIDNVFNREPPMGLTGTSEFSGIYDPRGRFFYVGAKVKIK